MDLGGTYLNACQRLFIGGTIEDTSAATMETDR
jgi:hypothetical protein